MQNFPLTLDGDLRPATFGSLERKQMGDDGLYVGKLFFRNGRRHVAAGRAVIHADGDPNGTGVDGPRWARRTRDARGLEEWVSCKEIMRQRAKGMYDREIGKYFTSGSL